MRYIKPASAAAGSCLIVPLAKNGKESKLFKDLESHLHDRAAAKKIWYFTQLDDVNKAYASLDRDVNGEFTYDAVSKLLNLDSLLSETTKERSKAYDRGLISRTGAPAIHTNHTAALDAAESFNKEAKEQIAVVSKADTGEVITKVTDRTGEALMQAEENANNNSINKLLLARLHSLGFDVSFVDDDTYAGIFDPMLARENASKLKTVIQIVKGEVGEEVFPEEFAHVILSGLKDDILKRRINEAFTDDVVRQVLGNDYDRYRELYKDGKMPLNERLREEAEGKVLADVIQKRDIEVPARSLFQRLWNKVKKMLGLLKEEDIDNALAQARDAVRPLAGLTFSGGLDAVISREQVLKHPRMYDLTQKLSKLAEIAEDGHALLSKRLSMIEMEGDSRQSTHIEKQRIKKLRKQLDDKRYAAACYNIMFTISQHVERLARLNEQFENISDSASDMKTIAEEANSVRRMGTALKAYLPYVKTLQSLDKLRQKGQIEMDDQTAADIMRLANETRATLENIQDEYRSMRFSVLKQLILLYYGNSPMANRQTDEEKAASVELLLQRADCDIRLGDTSLFSAGNSRSPLINLIHNIIVRRQADRDSQLNAFAAEMQEANARLHNAGYSNDFVYQRDENGIPTGYYVGPVDMARYERERQEVIDSVNNEKYDAYTRYVTISDWVESHTEEVVVDADTGRTEVMPKASIYGVEFDKGWSEEQKDYYKTLMRNKAKMDALLPEPAQHLYNAPQKRKDITQAFDAGAKGLKKQIWGKFKKEMTVVEDNPDYKQYAYMEEDGTKVVATDFDGKPIKKVPIYFTNKLDDMENLSTDSASALVSYAAMAINYGQMNEIAGSMLLMQEHLATDFEVAQTDGGKLIKDAFTAVGKTFTREYTKNGGASNIARFGSKYIDRMVFNDRKNALGKKTILGKEVDFDALFNYFMRYNSILRMGVNPMSGAVNLLQGEYQILSEATTNRYFSIKDAAWADKEYKKMLAEHIAHFNDIDRHDKMHLLIRTFNSSEDFFRDAQDTSYNQSAFKRVLGKGNIYFLNTMGEHKIHTQSMLALLKHTTVTRKSDNKQVSLYDCLEPVHDDKGWRLELSSDIEFDLTANERQSFFLNALTNNMQSEQEGKVTVKKGNESLLFQNVNVLVNHVNAHMFGGYSDAERGTMNSTALGRLVMQFRQWMPGTYDKLFSRRYYDAITGTYQEGAFNTLGKFILNLLQDSKNIFQKRAILWEQLTPNEKANINLCISQTALVILTAAVANGLLGWKDEDDAAKRFAAFTMRRLQSEVTAVYPLSPKFVKENTINLIKSPVPSLNTWENAFELMDVNTWFRTVKSGRYKGWNHALKTIYTMTPVVYNIGKTVDLAKYNYIFNIFN